MEVEVSQGVDSKRVWSMGNQRARVKFVFFERVCRYRYAAQEGDRLDGLESGRRNSQAGCGGGTETSTLSSSQPAKERREMREEQWTLMASEEATEGREGLVRKWW